MRNRVFLKVCVCVSLFVVLCSLIIFSSCVSSKDNEAAQSVVVKINGIGEVSLDKKEYIFETNNSYNKLTIQQKKLVTNYNILLDAIDSITTIEIEDEIANDPNRNISRSDLLGIWQSNYDESSAHYWNIWITQNEIYYMGSKTKDLGFDIIKSEYLITNSYSFDSIDKNLKLKQGKFYNSDLQKWFSFTVQINNGTYEMYVLGSPINNRFYKLG